MGNSGSNPPNDALILGLEKGGKTTLFESLTWKQGTSMDDNEKTLGFNYEYWEFRGQQIGLWDVGGGELARKLWRTMYETIRYKFIIYVIGPIPCDLYSPPMDKKDETDTTNKAANNADFKRADGTEKLEFDKKLYQSCYELKYLINEPYLHDTPFFVVLNQKKDLGRTAPPDEQDIVRKKTRMYTKMLDLSNACISDSKDFFMPNGETTTREKELRDRAAQKKSEDGAEVSEPEKPPRRVYFSIVELKEKEGAYGYNGFRQMVWKELENLEILKEKKGS